MNNSLNLITKKSLIFFLKSGKQRPGSWNRRDKVIRFFFFFAHHHCHSTLTLFFYFVFLAITYLTIYLVPSSFCLATLLFFQSKSSLHRVALLLRFRHHSLLDAVDDGIVQSAGNDIRPLFAIIRSIARARGGTWVPDGMIWPGVQRWKSRMKEKLSRQSKENAERKRKEFGIKCIHLWADLKLNPFPPRCTFSLAAFHSLSKRKLLKLLINDTPLSVCRAWVHLVYLRWI